MDGPNKRPSSDYNAMMFPVVVTDDSRRCVFRNGFAKKRFPLLKTGNDFSKYIKRDIEPGLIFTERIFGDPFIVTALRERVDGVERYVFLLAEVTFFRDRAFIKEILKDAAYMFSDMENSLCSVISPDGLSPEELRAKAKKILCRINRMHEYDSVFLRTLNIGEYNAGKGSIPVALFSVFTTIRKKLSDAGIEIISDCPKNACANVNVKAFSFVVLNIIQFIHLFSGEKAIRVAVSESGGRCRVSFNISDRDGVLDAYRTVASVPANGEIKDLAVFCPLYCAEVFCRKHRYGMKLLSENGEYRLVLSVKSSLSLPLEKMSAASDFVPGEIEKMCEEFFPPYFGA